MQIRSLPVKSITQLLDKNSCQGGEVSLAALGSRMTSNKLWILCEMVWMSVTSHGKYLWPPGTEKKKTGSPEEPLQAISSSLTSSSSTPLGLCLCLACVCACMCLCAYIPLSQYLCVCVSVCVSVCVCLHLHPVLVACPWLHHWRQLMLSHGSIVAAPAANNQRQLFGKYQRCLIGSTDGLDSLFTPQAPHASKKKCTRSIIISSMQTICLLLMIVILSL